MAVTDWRNNTAVICAVTGGYDYMKRHKLIGGVEYILYTDGTHAPTSKRWHVFDLPNPDNLDSRRLAKGPKMNPYAFEELLEFKYVIWIDGSMQIDSPDFISEILSFMNNGYVVSPHFDDRHCGYGEGELVIGTQKYKNEPMREQIDAYKAEGFPENYGLYECGISARDMTTPGLKELGELWYEQVIKWSVQDQLSFPYCLWKTGFKPDVLPQTFRNYGWVTVSAHTRGV